MYFFIINKSSLGWASDMLKLAVLFLHFCLLVRLAGLGINNRVVCFLIISLFWCHSFFSFSSQLFRERTSLQRL